MKKYSIIFILIAWTKISYAEWIRIGETDRAVHFIYSININKYGNLRKVWLIYDFKERQQDGEQSIRIKSEYDCKLEKSRVLFFSTHSGSMAKGKVLFVSDGVPTKWDEIPPETNSQDILKKVCLR